MIRFGFRLPWCSAKAPLSTSPPAVRPPGNPLALGALDQEVTLLLSKSATEEVASRSPPGFYGRIFVVPKASGGWRPVLDLSTLNAFLRNIPFRMETAAAVRDAMHPGDWAASIDPRDVYFHLLIHPRSRKWLRFVWRDKIFQFRALPFDLAPAPWIFTKVTRELCLHVRARGIPRGSTSMTGLYWPPPRSCDCATLCRSCTCAAAWVSLSTRRNPTSGPHSSSSSWVCPSTPCDG